MNSTRLWGRWQLRRFDDTRRVFSCPNPCGVGEPVYERFLFVDTRAVCNFLIQVGGVRHLPLFGRVRHLPLSVKPTRCTKKSRYPSARNGSSARGPSRKRARTTSTLLVAITTTETRSSSRSVSKREAAVFRHVAPRESRPGEREGGRGGRGRGRTGVVMTWLCCCFFCLCRPHHVTNLCLVEPSDVTCLSRLNASSSWLPRCFDRFC